MMEKAELLNAAMEAVKDRGNSYGTVQENFQRIADFWTVWLMHTGKLTPGMQITPRDVAMLNDLQKTARLIQTPGHVDSVVDKAGYAACYAACED